MTVNMAEHTSRCMGHQQTIYDGLSEVPCGSNTTCAAFSVRVLVDMAAIVAIVVEQVNDSKSVQNPVFAPPLHPFFTVHRLQPAALLLLKMSCETCTCEEAMSISSPPGFKTNAEANVRRFVIRGAHD